LSVVVGVFIKFFDDLDLLSKVIRVWLAIKIGVSGPSKPIGASLQLIRNVLIVVLLIIFFGVLFGIGGLASKWKVAYCVLVGRFHILIISSKSRVLSGI
jgi:hypothetical protein